MAYKYIFNIIDSNLTLFPCFSDAQKYPNLVFIGRGHLVAESNLHRIDQDYRGVVAQYCSLMRELAAERGVRLVYDHVRDTPLCAKAATLLNAPDVCIEDIAAFCADCDSEFVRCAVRALYAVRIAYGGNQ